MLGKELAEVDPPSAAERDRNTLASIGEGIIALDTAGRITFVNRALLTSSGRSQRDCLGQPLSMLLREHELGSGRAVENAIALAMQRGGPIPPAHESVLLAADGTERAVEGSVSAIRSDTGAVVGAVLLIRDVREPHWHEQSLQEALSYADSILQTLREPFLVLDKHLRVKTANRAFYETFHVAMGETEGRLVHELGSGQWDIPLLCELLEEVLVSRRVVDEFRVEHEFPSLGKRVMLLNARPFPPDVERPDLILLAIEDVTARQRVDDALRTSEIRYRRLFESAKDGILILDANDGRIVDANPFMSELLGYGREEFLGKELWQIGLFQDKAENEAAFLELQREKYVRYDHLPLVDEHGRQAEVEFVSNVYEAHGGRFAQCNIRDTSERTRMERELQAQALALADLHRRKDEFLAMLSHELRNPLAPIASALQLLRMQETEISTQRHCRELIARQLVQLTQIVDDLLDVSRITTGMIRLRPELCEVREIVENAIETARPSIEERGHDFSLSLPSRPIWLRADPTRIGQVVTNLLTNAAKYTERGGRIDVRVLREGNECALSVRDSGVGIPPELLARLFDPFSQGARSLDRSPGGLGIGLFIVKRILELHGGSVAVSSTVGRGSEFVVRLPTAKPSAPPTAQPSGVQDRPKARRLLVVDDNVDAAEALAMLLRAFGHEVAIANDGPSALQLALRTRPQAVLLDLGLPIWNGYEVAARMRLEPRLRGTVLIAITGYGRESDRQAALEAGFDHHMVKPVELATIQGVLATLGGP